MEGAPKNNHPESANRNEAPQPAAQRVERGYNIESLSDWRELKERAHESARKWVEAIDGFEDMQSGEQVLALKALQEELVDDNKNRFIDRVIAEKVESIMETMTDSERSEHALPLRTPDERVSTEGTPLPEAADSGYAHTLDYVHAANDNANPPIGAEQKAS